MTPPRAIDLLICVFVKNVVSSKLSKLNISSKSCKIVKSGGPELALELEKKGYENFN